MRDPDWDDIIREKVPAHQSYLRSMYGVQERLSKKRGEKAKKIFIYLFMYLSFIIIIIIFFFVLYGGTSGLHVHTHGHAWLGVVCCC